MKTVHIAIIAVAVVLVAVLITAGCVYATRQGTVRRVECIQHGGTYLDSTCVQPVSGA